MRCFIAIDIDKKTRAALGDLQQQIKNKTGIKKSDAKWVKPDATHLTLKFLGEVKDQEVIRLCDIVKAVAAGHKGFELDIEKLGCFGGRRPKVLWVGTGEGSDDLCRLAPAVIVCISWPKTLKNSWHGTAGQRKQEIFQDI